MTLGEAIKICRVSRGMSVKDIKQVTGISNSALSFIEANKRFANVETVAKLARGMNIPLFMLFYLASEPDERSYLPEELRDKLSAAALGLIGNGAAR